MQLFTPLEYLKIDVASNFGLDKKDWDERIAWFDENEDQLEKLLPAADEPALFYAGIQAYRKTLKGEPTGYPVSLDAASSGLQLLAVLTGCEASASLCGVVSTGHRADAYTIIYNAMCQEIGDNAKIARDDCKQAIMTSLYSSSAIPKKVFGEGEQLKVFYETMEAMAPGAWSLNQGLQSLWQPYALSHDWVLPDNFHAHVKVNDTVTQFIQVENAPVGVDITVNQGTKEGRSISPNIVHSIDGMIVREMHRRCHYDSEKLLVLIGNLMISDKRHVFGTRTVTAGDKLVVRLWDLYEASGFLSARILDYLCPENMGLVDLTAIRKLIHSLPEKSFPLISIHDCFRCHPNYANDMRRQYNQILSDIAKSDMLSFIASQITGKHIPVTKMADISATVLEADYALT